MASLSGKVRGCIHDSKAGTHGGDSDDEQCSLNIVFNVDDISKYIYGFMA